MTSAMISISMITLFLTCATTGILSLSCDWFRMHCYLDLGTLPPISIMKIYPSKGRQLAAP